jgi:hypothetical protein
MIGVHREVFKLIYHMRGGFTYETVWWKLPVYLRRFYMRRLSDQKEREAEQIKNAGNDDQFSGEGLPDGWTPPQSDGDGEGLPDSMQGEYSMTDRDKPELHEAMENAPPDIKRKLKNDG